MSDVTTAEARALSVQGPARATIPFSLRAVERRALLPAYGSQAREIDQAVLRNRRVRRFSTSTTRNMAMPMTRVTNQ